MGSCITHKKIESKPQFDSDRQISHSESHIKSLRPLDTTLYNLLRKQSQAEIIHSSSEGHLFANSNKISSNSLSSKQMKVLYNFKNIVLVGKPASIIKLFEEVSIKELYTISEKGANIFLRKYPIYDKKLNKPYKGSSIPILIFCEDQLISFADAKHETSRTIYIHSQKHKNNRIYEDLNIEKIIQPISKKLDTKAHIEHYDHQFKKIGKEYNSILLLHEDNLKQVDIRAILTRHLKKAYSVTESNADQYLRRFLPSDDRPLSQKNDPLKATAFHTQKQIFQSRPGIPQSERPKPMNMHRTEKIAQKKQKDPVLATSESAIKRLQSPVQKIEANEIIKPYVQILKGLHKESSLETVERTYSICILLISNISNNPTQESFKQVKSSNSKIYQILKYKNGKKLMEILGWNQDKENSIFWGNHVEAKYLKIFRVDLDLAYRIFQGDIKR